MMYHTTLCDFLLYLIVIAHATQSFGHIKMFSLHKQIKADRTSMFIYFNFQTNAS